MVGKVNSVLGLDLLHAKGLQERREGDVLAATYEWLETITGKTNILNGSALAKHRGETHALGVMGHNQLGWHKVRCDNRWSAAPGSCVEVHVVSNTRVGRR